jgi:hypothetical protein
VEYLNVYTDLLTVAVLNFLREEYTSYVVHLLVAFKGLYLLNLISKLYTEITPEILLNFNI